MKKLSLIVPALAFFCLAQPFSTEAAVYEIRAAGKNEAAAEGNCRMNALRQYLNSVVAPAESKQHAMELRSKIFRKLQDFTSVEIVDSQKEAKRVVTLAKVTVDEDAVRAALAEIPGITVAEAPAPSNGGSEDPADAAKAEKTQPEQPAAQTAQPDAQAPQSIRQSADGGDQDREGMQAAQAAAGDDGQKGETPLPAQQDPDAMPDAEFIGLVENAETDPQAVIDALSKGANPNARAENGAKNAGLPALMIYLGQDSGPKYQDKKAEVVSALIKAGADVKWADQDLSRSVLRSAWYASMVPEGEGMEIFRAVLAAKPDLYRTDGLYGRAFLHSWLGDAKHRTPEMLEYILSCGADPNLVQKDRKGSAEYGTPVLFEAIRGTVGEPLPAPFLQAMLKAGADPNIKNAVGETALVYAVKSGAADAVRLLLEAGADPAAAKEYADRSGRDDIKALFGGAAQ